MITAHDAGQSGQEVLEAGAEQSPWSAAFWLAPHDLLSLPSYTVQDHWWVASTKKTCRRLAQMPISRSHFLN